jgi:predicted DsbA family dithiol-disulfide isomerase
MGLLSVGRSAPRAARLRRFLPRAAVGNGQSVACLPSIAPWIHIICALACVVLSLTACAHRQRGGEGRELTGEDSATIAELLRAAEVPAARLDEVGRRRLLKLAAEQKCPCPVDSSETLAECVTAKRPCVRARFAVRAILRGVVRREPDAELSARLVERFGPREPEQIELRGAPCRGADLAPVTLVVWSDFECPHCALGRKLVEVIEREAGARLRVCFKNYPLVEMHPRARLAAQAALAAASWGMFWAMHDRLFDHQKELDRDDLLDHARALGITPEHFRRVLDSPEIQRQVERDRQQAIGLRIRGTPTFFINGREYTDPKTVPEILDWIAEAIALARAPASRPRQR